MEDEFHLRGILADITGGIGKMTLDDLKTTLIPECGIGESVKTFLQLVEKLRNRSPNDYLDELGEALVKIDRADIYDKINNFLSKVHQGRCEQERSYDREQDELVVSHKDTYEEFLLKDNYLENNYDGIRNYQRELAQPAIDKQNSIICAPTGSGKTVTAGFICKVLIEKNPKIKIVFLVPIRCLGKQQSKLLSEMLNSKVLCNLEMELAELLQNFNAVVLTPQILINCLEAEKVNLEDLDLIVFDECHHTKLYHPYNKLMNIYHLKRIMNVNCKLPQIVGLSASLGTDNSSNEEEILRHFANMCARLDGSIITIQDPKNKLELLNYNSSPTKDQIITCPPRKDLHFFLALNSLMLKIEKDYKISSISIKGHEGYRNKIIQLQNDYESQEGTMKEILACMVLNLLNEALLLYNDSTEEYVMKFVKKELQFLIENEIWMKLRNMAIETFEEFTSTSQVSWNSNQKLVKLYDILEKMSGENATCILITKTCRNVDFLYEFLTSLPYFKENLYILKVVGKQNEEYGMSEAQQIETISNFRYITGHKSALLIATNVIQEGMDLPKCNSVIRYNFVSDEIGTIQSRGRARAPDSKIYLIVDEDSIDVQREYTNLFRERKMLDVLNSLPEKQAHFQNLVEEAKKNLIEILKAERIRDASKTYDAKDVEIYCKLCKIKLCSGNDIKKCEIGYIIIESQLELISNFERWPDIRRFRYEDRLGDMKCKTCMTKLAIKIKLRRAIISYAYVPVKKCLSWKLKESRTYNQMPKKWNELDFYVNPLEVHI